MFEDSQMYAKCLYLTYECNPRVGEVRSTEEHLMERFWYHTE